MNALQLMARGKRRLRFRQGGAAALLVLALAGCDSSSELYAGLSERDANDITAALSDHGIEARKTALGKQLYSVSVPASDFSRSVALLHAVGLPNSSFTRMGDIFKKDGMISTPTEERARFLYALSQELESTLSQIDGVVLARVHPVLSERVVPGEPALPSSCSVLIKHVPGWDTAAYESRIRKLVLASIPGLADTPEKVAVVFVPSEALALHQMSRAGGGAGTAPLPTLPTSSTAPASLQPNASGATSLATASGTKDIVAVSSRTLGAPGEALSRRSGLNGTGWLIGVAAVVIGIGGPSAWLWWHRRRAQADAQDALSSSGEPVGDR